MLYPRMALGVLLIVVAAVIGIWDLYCLVSDNHPATVSTLFRNASHQWPVLPFAAGALAGHLFW